MLLKVKDVSNAIASECASLKSHCAEGIVGTLGVPRMLTHTIENDSVLAIGTVLWQHSIMLWIPQGFILGPILFSL